MASFIKGIQFHQRGVDCEYSIAKPSSKKLPIFRQMAT